MLLVRRPCPALQPFIQRLWFSRSEPQTAAALERVLPTGSMHLVLRLVGAPLRVYPEAAGEHGIDVGLSVVGGARSMHYVRDISQPSSSVGAQFHPGTAPCLLGVAASELAERHIALDEIWGARTLELREQLLERKDPQAQLALFEHALCERLPRVRGVHPAVAETLSNLHGDSEVRELVKQSGYSHRRFISLFEEAVGLTPKVFLRVRRFQRVLSLQNARPALGWAVLALEAGYTDQAHFNREFRAFTGMTPGQYRALGPLAENHVPMRDTPFQFRTRPGRGHTPE